MRRPSLRVAAVGLALLSGTATALMPGAAAAAPDPLGAVPAVGDRAAGPGKSGGEWPGAELVAPRDSLPGLFDRFLVLTARSGEASDKVERYAVLACSSATSGFTTGTSVCEQLEAAKGDPSVLQSSGAICTMEHGPVTVTAHGVWDWRLVRFERTYTNACVLHRETGQVFAFYPSRT